MTQWKNSIKKIDRIISGMKNRTKNNVKDVTNTAHPLEWEDDEVLSCRTHISHTIFFASSLLYSYRLKRKSAYNSANIDSRAFLIESVTIWVESAIFYPWIFANQFHTHIVSDKSIANSGESCCTLASKSNLNVSAWLADVSK